MEKHLREKVLKKTPAVNPINALQAVDEVQFSDESQYHK